MCFLQETKPAPVSTHPPIKWVRWLLHREGGRGVTMDSYFHLKPKLRISGAIPPPHDIIFFIFTLLKLFFSFSVAINKTGAPYAVICMCSMTCCYRYLYVQHDMLLQVSLCAAWRVVTGISMCSMTCCYRYLYVQHDVLLQVSVCAARRVVTGICMCSMTCCYRYLYVQHDVLLQVSECAAQSTLYEHGTKEWIFVTGFFYV